MSHLPLGLLCLLIAAVFIYVEHREQYRLAVPLKGAASVCFVVLGALSAGLSTDAATARLVVTGLVLGAIADVLLALRHVFLAHAKKVFMVGIIVFLIGHVAYLAAMVPHCSVAVPCVLVGAAATAPLMRWIFGRIEADKTLKLFGIVYIGVVTVLNAVAVGALLFAPTTFVAIFVLGALLFLTSDVVLILNSFGPEQRFDLRIANISLYYIAQLLIALSLQVL